MENLEELEGLVKKLKNECNKEEQIKILQKIGKMLITEYEIKIGNITIEPLLIEAYYYNCKNFPDCNTHMNPSQKNFNELYRHSIKNGLKSNGRKGGVDICLALNKDKKEPYYLSFLIKNSLVNNTFCKQVELNSILNSIPNISNLNSGVLYKRNCKYDKHCIYLKRKGLKKECFKDAKIAVAYPWNNSNDDFSFENENIDGNEVARGKQWRIALSNIEKGNGKQIADCENKSKITEIYWKLALSDYENSKKLRKCNNMLYFSSQLNTPKYKPAADRMFAALDLFNIKYKLLNNTKDIWLRDFMPVKTKSGKYVSFRYEPSYLDGSPELRTDLRRDIVPNFDFKNLVYSDINLDGGNVVFSPSKEKVIISDRVFSENHGISEAELTAKLEKLLEASLIIIPSLKSDMTGHADGMVRFVGENTAIVNAPPSPYGFEICVNKSTC